MTPQQIQEYNRAYRIKNRERLIAYEAARRTSRLEEKRRWGKLNYQNNGAVLRAKKRAYYANPVHRSAVREQQKRAYWANPEKFRSRAIAAYRMDADRWKARSLQHLRRYRAELRDHIVRRMIFDMTGLPKQAIPDELVEAKRVHLQLHRYLRGLK